MDEGHRLARLGGDPDRVAPRAQPLGQLDGASQHMGWPTCTLAARARRPRAPSEKPWSRRLPVSVSGSRTPEPFDEHRVERGARLLAETDRLMAGLVQLPLDALRFPGGGERPELDREARGTLGRGRAAPGWPGGLSASWPAKAGRGGRAARRDLRPDRDAGPPAEVGLRRPAVRRRGIGRLEPGGVTAGGAGSRAAGGAGGGARVGRAATSSVRSGFDVDGDRGAEPAGAARGERDDDRGHPS